MESNKPTTNHHVLTLSNLSGVNWRAWLPSRGNVLTLAVMVALFWAQSAHALPWTNAPAAASSISIFPYQGRLADNSGTPITTVIPMTFRLYNASSGGTPLWEEGWAGVQVTGGLFNVMLGSQTPIPQSIVNNTSLWLGISVGADSEMTPRVQLGSVPFAAQALTVPDGSITTAKLASNVLPLVQSGIDGGVNGLPDWTLSQGTGYREFRKTITFSTPYSTPPQVVIGLSVFDGGGSLGTRIGIAADNITTTGFELVIHTWADSIVGDTDVNWIAVGNR